MAKRYIRPFPTRVYFARSTNGLIKIGYSNDLRRRMRELSCETKTTVTVLASFPGDRIDEYLTHYRFHESHVRGEWFRPSPALMAYIAELSQEAA